MSIVRIGLGEHGNYGDGWDAIFGKSTKQEKAKTDKPAKASAKKKAKTAKKKKQ